MAVYSVKLLCTDGDREVLTNSLSRAIDIAYTFRTHHDGASYGLRRMLKFHGDHGVALLEMYSSEMDPRWKK